VNNEEGEMVHDQPEEDDYVLFNSGRLGQYTSVSHSGDTKEFKDDEEAENWIKENMNKEKIHSDVFFQDDHGGITPRRL
jgi:hypothetical protein